MDVTIEVDHISATLRASIDGLPWYDGRLPAPSYRAGPWMMLGSYALDSRPDDVRVRNVLVAYGPPPGELREFHEALISMRSPECIRSCVQYHRLAGLQSWVVTRAVDGQRLCHLCWRTNLLRQLLFA